MSNNHTSQQTPSENDAITHPTQCRENADKDEPMLYSNPQVDETTGATPGVATACRDLGVGDLNAALAKFKCKPPGQ